MLNKLSYNLASSLNESESEVIKVNKKVLIESDGVKTVVEEVDPAKEERLASLKTQIEKDGAQLAADEKEAIEKEVAELEKEVYEEGYHSEKDIERKEKEENGTEQGKLIPEKKKKTKQEESETLTEEEGDSTFTLKINTSNEVFEGEPEVEVARILNDISNNLEYTESKNILDVNGNVIGKYGFGFEGVSLGESEELNEDYSDKLGGDPADFISDLKEIRKAIVESIDYDGIATKLAHQMVMDFIETIDNQIEMTANKYGLEDIVEEGCSKQEIKEAEEVEVTGLQVIKEQGNIFMLEDENKKMIVGENYNAEEGIIENAEIYENKEEADKDYLGRCDIIKDGEEFKAEETAEDSEAEEEISEGIIDDFRLNHRAKKADKAADRFAEDKSKRNKKKMNKAFDKLDAEKDRQIKKHKDKIEQIKNA